MDRDAEAGAGGNGAREHGDRPANQMVLVAFGQLLAASLGVAVVTGELLVRPATCEPVVGGGEIAHGSVREHDVNAPARRARAAGVSSSGTRPAGAIPTGSHGRMVDRRDRAPPATRASCGCRCDSAAAPRRCDHVSDAPGGPGPGGWSAGCDRACTGAPPAAQPMAPRLRPPVSGSDLRLASRVAGRFLRSYLKFAYGRARATSVEAVTPGLRSQLMRDRAQVTPAERAAIRGWCRCT